MQLHGELACEEKTPRKNSRKAIGKINPTGNDRNIQGTEIQWSIQSAAHMQTRKVQGELKEVR